MRTKFLAYFFTALVAGAVVLGIWTVGSPVTARERRLDAQRVSDLETIKNQVIYYWQGKGHLPAALSDLIDATRGVSVPKDPETGKEYSYAALGEVSFLLCAEFSAPSEDMNNKVAPSPMAAPVGGNIQNWQHSSGRVCFNQRIDKDFYKPIK